MSDTSAIIAIAGKQFPIKVGEKLIIDRQDCEPGAEVVINDVLLLQKGDQLKIGQPLVTGASVTLKAIDHMQGEKIHVRTYKAKSRYRKHRGHRQQQTTFEVVKIS